MCDDYTNHLLECILDRLESDEYESGPIYTVGGGPGTYQLRSPYNTECEYLPVGAQLAATSGNGLVVITNNNAGMNTFTLGTSLGLVSSGSDMNNAFEGIVLPTSTTQSPLMAVDHWQPLGRGAALYIYVTGTASYAYIALRRRIDKYIPQMERMFPKTHSSPQSRRALRQLPAASNFAAGFESQYPDLSGAQGKEKIPYRHEQINEQDDTRNIGNAIRRVARYGR